MKITKKPVKQKQRSSSINSNEKNIKSELEEIQDRLNKVQQLPEIRRLVAKADELSAELVKSSDNSKTYTEIYHGNQLVGEGAVQDYIMSAAGQYPGLVYQLSIQPLRKRFIKEYHIKTTPEYMLLDRIMFAYLRATQLDSWINSIFGKGSVDKFGMESYRVLESAKEKVERQLVRNLEALMRLKLPPLNLNIRRVDNMNLANQQQVNINQRDGDEKGERQRETTHQLVKEGREKRDEKV
jgi:hypothetical protein